MRPHGDRHPDSINTSRDFGVGTTALPSRHAIGLSPIIPRGMEPPLRVVTALLRDESRIARARRAGRGFADLVVCASWGELVEQCRDRPLGVLLIDLWCVTGVSAEAAFDEVRELRRRHPALAAVIYADGSPARARDLFDAGRLGLEGLVVAGIGDDAKGLRRAIDDAEATGVARLLRPALGGISARVRDATMLCVVRAYRPIEPRELAGTIGIGRRRLAHLLAADGFPTTRRLIAWGRLIMAARLLEDPSRSANQVARNLGYPSGTALRNACHRYLGAAPQEIRERGGAAFVIGRLVGGSEKRERSRGAVTPRGRSVPAKRRR